jgi:DNA-binding NarL/FixJ family response regulator
MPLADVKIHAAIKRFLDHAGMRLTDAEVSAAINDSYKKTSTDKQARSGNSIVVLITNENLDRLFEALEENGEATLRDTSQRDLGTVAWQVLRGEAPLDSDMAAQLLLLLAGKDKARPKPPVEPLTPRQLDVVKLLAQGKTNQEIAQELVLSAGTVRTHVQRILAKLDVSDRTGAVVRAIELGLIAPESGA